jgi:hypothetical protein
MSQMQLFRTVSYDPKKRIYWIDLGHEKFASIHVDENDIVLKTKGFGHRTWLYGRYLGIIKGSELAQSFMIEAGERYARKTGLNMKDGSKVKKEKQVAQTARFTVQIRNCTDPHRAIKNYQRLGFQVNMIQNNQAFECSITY